MKKNYLNRMLMVFAMIFAVGMFAACSSSDDKADSTDKKKEETPVATSGTLYVFAMVSENTRGWLDCSFSCVKAGSTADYKSIATDATSLTKLDNQNLVKQIKAVLEENKEKETLIGLTGTSCLKESDPVLLFKVGEEKSFPLSCDVKGKFALKAGFDPATAKNVNCRFIVGGCFIDDLGNVKNTTIYEQHMFGVDTFTGLCDALAGWCAKSVKVTKDESYFNLAVSNLN